MSIKYIVNLSDQEREYLYQVTSKGKTTGRIVKRAQMLLLADEGHPDETIATMLKVGESTVHRTRQKCVEQGVEFAFKERPRKGREKKLDGKTEAFLVATACSDPPEGRQCCTMEDVLELYEKPYDPLNPQVCFDERPCQLISETKIPLPTEPGQPQRYDSEYKREGTCNLFAFFQPLGGWRQIKVTKQRTAIDFAHCMKDMVDVFFPRQPVVVHPATE